MMLARLKDHSVKITSQITRTPSHVYVYLHVSSLTHNALALLATVEHLSSLVLEPMCGATDPLLTTLGSANAMSRKESVD